MTDTDLDLCKTITSLSPLKFIIKTIDPNELDIKLIFIGPRPENVKPVLTKLEQKKKLSTDENKLLESSVSHYNVKFGDTNKYNVFFIYKYIEENLEIEHIRIILYEIIKEYVKPEHPQHYLPPNMLIYKHSRNNDYKHYVNLINYIFKDNAELDNEAFFNQLYKMTYMNKDEIENKLKELLPAKYKLIDPPFTKKKTFTYETSLDNDEIFHLLISIPNILTVKYNYGSTDMVNTYLGYQNLEHLLEKYKTEFANKHNKTISNLEPSEIMNKLKIKFFVEENIDFFSEDFLYLNLNFYNKTINNEYFIVLKNDMKKILTKEMVEFYYPDRLDKKYKKLNNSEYEDIYRHFKLTVFNKSIYNDSIIKINNCFCKNIIFDSLSTKLKVKYELKNLYNNLTTNYYQPVIKYVSNDEVKYIKINKGFLQNHTYQELNQIIISRHNNKYKNENIKEYIQFKWRMSKSIIITIDFYENGYTVAYFDDEDKIPIGKELLEYMNAVQSTIKYIKKIINAKHLKLPNVSNLFNENSNYINYSTLVNGNVTVNGKFDMKKLQTKEEFKEHDKKTDGKLDGKLDVKLLINRIRKHITSFHHFVLNPNISNDSINIIYKQVNKFYSNASILQFINSRLQNKQTKPDKKEIDDLFKLCKRIFFIDDIRLKELYDNRDSHVLKTNETLLYGIQINIKINSDGNIEFHFENIDKYYSVKLILFYFKVIFSNIAYELENNLEEVDIKVKDKNQSIVKDKNQSISKQSKYISHIDLKREQLDLDFDKNLDLDIDLNLDLDLDLDLDKEDKESKKEDDEDIDIRDLAKLIQLDHSPEDKKHKGDNKDDKRDEHIQTFELNKSLTKNKKLKYSKYMSTMRSTFDKELYNPKTVGKGDSLYNKVCHTQGMHQPYIVSKKDIDSYDDPEAFTGYIKYRNNYYICPRIWDAIANKPISAKKFIENGLKSPYTNGKAIPPEYRNKMPISEQNSVIIRKPTSDTTWEDVTKNKDWPEILKKTEKDAYPYLTQLKDHPKKLCAPCCGIKKPFDIDPNIKKIQQFYKLASNKECKDQEEKEEVNINETENIKHIKEDIIICTNNIEQQYILNETSDLEKCRFGLIPKNLNIMINNNHNLFLNPAQNQLIEFSNVFLRRGVEQNKKDNILETFSVIFNTSLVALKNLIITKLTPDVFIVLNNGELIDIFSSSNILPNSLDDYEQFITFIDTYHIVFELMDIDKEMISKYKYNDIETINQKIIDNTITANIASKLGSDSKFNKNTLESISNLKKIFVTYKIFKSFYNFIAHILDKNEYKNYTHFLDLFSKSIEWLNKEGTNILIFDKTTSKLMCNPYYDLKRNKYIILIKESKYHFVPLVHIHYIYKNTTVKGIFDIHKINLSSSSFNNFENNIANKKLLELTKDRTTSILNLIVLHKNICKFTYQQNTNNLIKDLEEIEILPVNQIAFTTTQIEFIKVSDLLIPIYPIAIQVKHITNKFKILENEDMISINKYITVFNIEGYTPFAKLLAQYNYKISKIFYDEIKGLITSIQFVNNLVVPVIPEKYTLKRITEIKNLMIKHKELKSNEDPHIESLFRPAYFDFQIEISPTIDIVNIRNSIYKDFIYNYFKFDFSRIIQEKTSRVSKLSLEASIINYNKKGGDFNNTINELVDTIINIMKKRIFGAKDTKDNKYNGDTSYKVTSQLPQKNQIILKVCSRTKKANKCKSKFCKYDNEAKQCYLDMDIKNLEYFSYLLANDLINNKIESVDIIKGSFIPEFNMRNKIFRNPDEILFNPVDLANELTHVFESGIHSKLKKDISLSEYLKDDREHIFNKNDDFDLEKTNINGLKKIMNSLINDVVDLSIKNIFTEDKIYTTPFNKNGIYDGKNNIGECVFPFFDKTRKKYVYQCIPKNNGYMCPTKLDFNVNRRPDKWGYCPEKIETTKQALNVIEIDAVGDENEKEYKTGKCDFPFIEQQDLLSIPHKHSKKDLENSANKEDQSHYKLKYDCNEVKSGEKGNDTNSEVFSWCPIKYNSRKTKKNINIKEDENKGEINNELLRAADKYENIRIGKWYNGKFNINKAVSKKFDKGYCQPPIKTQKGNIPIEEDEGDLPELTFDNYIPYNCRVNLTPSKGGYSRNQLYNFGVKHLKIPHSQLKKGQGDDTKLLLKDDLCRIINNKFREIKLQGSKNITDDMKLEAYTGKDNKDIDNCGKGESKGGYSFKELQEIATIYFGLSEEDIKTKNMHKEAICKHINKEIKKIKYNKEHIDLKEQDLLYNKGFNGDEAPLAGALADEEDDEDDDSINFNSKKEEKLNMAYTSDIKLCKETPNRGGLGLKELKHIAIDNFGISIEHKTKEQICDDIEEKLKNIAKEDRLESRRATRISASKISKLRYSFDDILKSVDKDDEDSFLEKSRAKNKGVEAIEYDEDDDEEDHDMSMKLSSDRDDSDEDSESSDRDSD